MNQHNRKRKAQKQTGGVEILKNQAQNFDEINITPTQRTFTGISKKLSKPTKPTKRKTRKLIIKLLKFGGSTAHQNY